MDWLDTDLWWQWIKSAEYFLRDIESKSIGQWPLVIRFVVYYVAGVIAQGIVYGVIFTIGLAIHSSVVMVMDAAARWVLHGRLDLVAPGYVRLQALTYRARLTQTTASFRRRPTASLGERAEQAHDAWPAPLGPLQNALSIVVSFVVTFISLAASTLFVVVRSLVGLRLANLAALVFALWFAGLLRPLLSFVGQIQIGDIQLSVVMAAGALLAVIYAAANSDLRGRAELNKTASLRCRTVLHGCTQPLIAAADALGDIRRMSAARLHWFPTTSELEQITGRTDLGWRLGLLLPEEAGAFRHDRRDAPILRHPKVRAAFSEIRGHTNIPSRKLPSGVVQADIGGARSRLEEAVQQIFDQLGQLDKEGFLGKLDRVMNRAGTFFLARAYRREFGLVVTRFLVVDKDETWLSCALGEDGLKVLQSEWADLADVDPDDRQLRRACEELQYSLRQFVRDIHLAQWEAAVMEYQLRYIAETIDKSLWPRLTERIRQAFGK